MDRILSVVFVGLVAMRQQDLQHVGDVIYGNTRTRGLVVVPHVLQVPMVLVPEPVVLHALQVRAARVAAPLLVPAQHVLQELMHLQVQIVPLVQQDLIKPAQDRLVVHCVQRVLKMLVQAARLLPLVRPVP